MNYDNIVFCKINGKPTIARSFVVKNKKNVIEGIVFQDLKDGKNYIKSAIVTNINKSKYIPASVTDVRPLKGLLTKAEFEECINSPDVETYINNRI